MALVANGWELTVSLIDNGGNVSNKVYNLTSASAAEATTDTATILAALDAVTDAVIKSYRISEVYIEDALVLPAGMVQIENLASIVAQVSGDPLKKANFLIPAPNAGIFVGISGTAANQVDVQDTALVTYATIFGVGQQATLSDGETIGFPLLSGKRIHRASRKG